MDPHCYSHYQTTNQGLALIRAHPPSQSPHAHPTRIVLCVLSRSTQFVAGCLNPAIAKIMRD